MSYKKFSAALAEAFLVLLLVNGFAPSTSAATLVWTNNSPGNWNTAANWSPNQIPESADDVAIGSGAQVTLDSSVVVSNFTFSAGTLLGAGSLTVNGQALWTGGDLCSALTIASSASLVISNTVSFGYNSGARNGGGSLTNLGVTTWGGSMIYGYGQAKIQNVGTWLFTANNSLSQQGGTNIFVNTGTMAKISGTGRATIEWDFNSTGTINTPTGSFGLPSSVGTNLFSGTATINFSSLKSSWTISSNAVLNWSDGDLTGKLTVAPGGTLTMTNSVSFGYDTGARNGGGALTNFGTVIVAGSTHYGYGEAIIYNAGLWQIWGNINLSSQFGTNRFYNVGRIEKLSGSGRATIEWAFNSTGDIATPTGSLQLNDWVGTNVVHGAFNWAGGTLNGDLTVPVGSTLYCSSTMLKGTLSAEGTVYWSDGGINGALNVSPGGLLSLSNSILFGYDNGTKDVGGSITNFGTVLCGGTTHYGYGGAVIHNAGLWRMTANNHFSAQFGTNRFVNVGTLEKTAGTSSSGIDWEFNNNGIINTPTGSFQLSNCVGTNLFFGTAQINFQNLTATWTVSSNSFLNWLGNNLVGEMVVAPGGTLAISNSVTFGYNNGSADSGGSLTNFGTVIWAGGTSYGYGNAVICNEGLWRITANNSLVNQQGTNVFLNRGLIEKISGTSSATIGWWFNNTGTINTPSGSLTLPQWTGFSTMYGTANVRLSAMTATLNIESNAVFNWIDGDLSGTMTVAPGGTLAISNGVSFGNNGGLYTGGALTNSGTVIWAGGTHYGYGNSVIHNAGTWRIVGNNSLVSQNGTNRFFNAGVLEKISGASSASIGWQFNSTGTILTPSGTLALSQWFGDSVFHGDAQLNLGTMNGALLISPNATLNWAGGDLAGAMTVGDGGTLTVSNNISFGNNGGLYTGGTLTNNGTVIWAGGTHYGYGNSLIVNQHLWQLVANNNLVTQNGTNVFINTGTLQKISGSSSATIGWDFQNTGIVESKTGTIALGGKSLQNGGATRLNGGNVSFTQPFQLLGGELSGSNTVSGTITNSAVVRPGGTGPGVLTVAGSYIQTSAGRLDIQLGGTNVGSTFDQLDVNGPATFGGALDVTLLDPFVPAVSNQFRVVTFTSFGSDFNEINGLVLFTNLALQANYTGTALDLLAVETNSSAALPVILSQPQSQTIINGQDASFAVSAAGTRPISYQWQFNGANLPGESAFNLFLANAQTNQSGAYRVIVTNSAGAVTSSVAMLTVRPVADLVIDQIVHATNVVAGQPFNLSWRTLNQGSQTAVAPWTESVSYSTNASGVPAKSLGSFVVNNSLASGQSLARTQQVIFPGGLDGTFYLVLRTDTGNSVAEESNEDNNTSVSTTSLRVRSPDLKVASIVAPNSAEFNEAIPIQWSVTNAGSAPVFSAWNDRVYLSANSNSVYGATVLTNLSVTNVPFADGTILSNSATVSIPLTPGFLPGNYFLLVAADAFDAIAESVETNNLLAKPITLSLPPLPDLAAVDVSAPVNALPGQPVELTWSTTNQGNAALSGVWSETIYLATNSSGAGAIELGTLFVTNSLESGAGVTRTQQVNIPVASPLGNVWLAVSVDSRNDIFESVETNNLGVATNATFVPALLTLQFNTTEISEGAAQPIHASVTRNGSRATALTVALTNSDPAELNFQTEIIIPAGQASATFDIASLADGIVDGTKLVNISAAAAGFPDATAQITVRDADRPSLTLTFATNSVVEGNSLSATVSRDAGTNSDLVVNVSSSNPGHLLPPESVVIPAGQFSATFELMALDNSFVELPANYLVTVSATNHNSDSESITVEDDDVPQAILDFDLSSVSENVGPQAAMGTILRTPVTAAPIYVELECDHPEWLLVPSLVVIPASESSVSFPVATVDNELIDGSRSVQVHFWIKTSPGGARVSPGIPATLTVTDDDGPALKLSLTKTLVGEGLNPATTATISRNTGTNGALTVNLNSNFPGEATVPASVLIPDGAASAVFNIATIDDQISDGNRVVTITASASGFSDAKALLTVTDVNQPDLVISSVFAPTNTETEAFASIGYQLRNQGVGGMSSNTIVQRIYLSRDPLPGDDQLLGEYTFSGGLPAAAQISQTFSIRMPQMAGTYWIIVEADAENVVSEILEDNNRRISAVPIQIDAAYDAEVSTTLESAPANTPVPLAGHAFKPSNHAPVPFALVNLHINVRGTHRVISALTDAAGNFATTWQPLPGEAGFYEIGAAHPGFTNAPTQDSFSLFGMNANPAAPALLLNGQTVVTGAVQIVNASDLPLTGIAAQSDGTPGNLNFNFSLATNSLGSFATNLLNYTIASTDGLAAQSVVNIHVTSAQGAMLDIPFSVSVKPLTAQLVLTPSPLVRGMKRGAQTFATFSVTNNGGADSGPITVSLPPILWMSLSSPNPLPSLAPGEGREVTLQLVAATNMPLSVFTGNMFLSANGSVASLPFEFRVLSESKGALKIKATDDFTYNSTSALNVTNAIAVVRDAVSGEVATNGVTDANGEWIAKDLPEGYYEIEVSADKHTSYKGTHFISAGVTNEVETFMARQTVRYTWTVVPTEIEDRYRIVVETEFEANVPAPVVTITPSVIDLADLEDQMQVDLKIENHGLIAAQNFHLEFDEHEGILFEPLISQLGTLPAKSTYTVPLTIRRVSIEPQRAGVAADAIHRLGSCFATGRAVHSYQCGGFDNIQVTTITFPNAGDCLPSISLPHFSWLPGGGGGAGSVAVIRDPPSHGRGYGPGGGGGGYGGFGFGNLFAFISEQVPALAIPNPCDPDCLPKLIPALKDCVESLVPSTPMKDCVKGAKDCALGAISEQTAGTAYTCFKAGLSCAEAAGKSIPGPWKWLPVVDCAYGLLTACAEPAGDARGPVRQGAVVFSGPYAGLLGTLQTRLDRLMTLHDYYAYFYGDAAWFESEEQGVVGDFMEQFNAVTDSSSDNGELVSASELEFLLTQPLPLGVNSTHVRHLVERWNRTFDYWQAGIFTMAQVPPGDSTDFVAFDQLHSFADAASNAIDDSEAEGNASLSEGFEVAKAELIAAVSVDSGGTCAKVKLRLEQQAVLSRDAFKATLEINNTEGKALENISVTLGVFDQNGNDASGLFGIQLPQFSGINGTNGSGTLATDQLGQINWTLVPSADAAPTNATVYFVSGGLHYTIDGNTVTVPLAPADITVYPAPRLSLKYFHQRDVFSDDPWTDSVEPAIPFSLGVMVENKGQGTAKDFRITSAQPQIVENEKGLLIDFKIIATEVAGKNLQPTLIADFGDIGPGTNAIARWLMTSTLQGLFIDYKASFEHIDGLGNPKLSLIDDVSIHETTHLVNADGIFSDGRPDFLVNDIPDLHDWPDSLYLSSGATNPVQVVTNAVPSGTPSSGNLEVELNAAMPGGWTYLRVQDPANGQYRLVNVLRADGTTLPLDNFWVTDRTFIGLGKRPLRENVLHLLDYNSAGNYTLIYAENPQLDTTPPSSAVALLPPDSSSAIALNWSGSDNVGIVSYDIYVSENGGPFSRWLANAVNTGAIFQGVLGSTYSFYSIAVDAAGNREEIPAAPDAQTVISRTNRPPELASIANQTIVEGQTLALNINASDPDNDGIFLSLGSGAPSGLVLNSANRVLQWATSEAHGPGTNAIFLIARDNGIPSLSATQTFSIVVLESNSPPVLASVVNQVVSEGQLLKITNSASDFDLPPQSLTFSLGAGAPAGAGINPTNGLFTWLPNEFQGGVTNSIQIIVSDHGEPPLRATQTVNIVVLDTRPDFNLSIGTTHLLSGASGNVPLQLDSGADLTNVVLQFSNQSDRFSNLRLENLAPQVGAANLLALGSNQFAIHFESAPGGALQGSFPIAQLAFDTIPNEHSAIAVLRGESLSGNRASSTNPLQGSAASGRVFIIGEEPILDSSRPVGQQLGLTLYARTGEEYRIERKSTLGVFDLWNEVQSISPSNLQTVLAPQTIQPGTGFFRVRYLPALTQGDAKFAEQIRTAAVEPVRVLKPEHSQGDFLLRFAVVPGATYRVEYTDSLTPANWIWKTNLVVPSGLVAGPEFLELREKIDQSPRRFYRVLRVND